MMKKGMEGRDDEGMNEKICRIEKRKQQEILYNVGVEDRMDLVVKKVGTVKKIEIYKDRIGKAKTEIMGMLGNTGQRRRNRDGKEWKRSV